MWTALGVGPTRICEILKQGYVPDTSSLVSWPIDQGHHCGNSCREIIMVLNSHGITFSSRLLPRTTASMANSATVSIRVPKKDTPNQ